MKRLLQSVTIVTLALLTIVLTVQVGKAEWLDGKRIRVPAFPTHGFMAQASQPLVQTDLLSDACAVKPFRNKPALRRLPAIQGTLPLSRFRQISASAEPETPNYTPRETVALAHPTNFGRRFVEDLDGQPVQNDPVVVIHETVGSAQSTLNYFQTPHPSDDDQVSYHSLIREDGTIVYLVPPTRRAFGAGNSVFSGTKGNEAVKTNAVFPPSVNNFAYHISLVTPSDGRGNGSRHSGYTQAQYQSLAWLVAKTGVSNDRITTHRLVDRSRQRQDPRSFDVQTFAKLLALYPKTNDISMQCTLPAIPREE
jgi:hypothetical protein